MSTGSEFGDEYDDYVEQFKLEDEAGEPMTFIEWIVEKKWKAEDDELESGIERSKDVSMR
jgi:hypothetical protein